MNSDREDRAYSFIAAGLLAAKGAMVIKSALAVAAANKAAIAAGAGGIAIGAALRNKASRKWSKNKGIDVAEGALHATKAVAHETRQTVIAGRIAGKIARRKDTTKQERQFLKDQSKDVIRSIPIAAATALPVPGSELAYVIAAKKLKLKGLLPGTQKIPKAYLHKNKWKQLDKFIKDKEKKLRDLRHKINSNEGKS